MGWQDRDYTQPPYDEPAFATRTARRPPPLTLTLMILHGAVYFLMLAVREGADQETLRRVVLDGQAPHPLGILFHPLGNGSLFTAAFVVLAVWSLAGRLERQCGAIPVAIWYVLGNLLGGAAYFLLARLAPAMATEPLDYPVGALAAWVGAAWQQFRRAPVQIFGRTMTLAGVYAICAGIVAGLVLVRTGAGGLAWVAAAGVGVLIPLVKLRLRLPARRPRIPRATRRRSSPRRAAAAEVTLDHLLAKIARDGLDSLSDQERAQLEAARREKLRESR